ncbi:Hsp70 family protein [Ramlibacter tataouinensis]|uniref:Chaperone protein-like protein n=1 Tax=Ramlibacter tataouinensis (strain ATCC BAA-407 / DSM 14655 / LMG 21543 / TTB310) TaxID=365046 RepID=F5Y5Q4_RAMTT|nr:Hsp70 family protein [Ramlibacter tataouinensis]AEG93938.1 chaperone protein-like protein [Ramlibacter tataouinensis TTB310]
MSRAPGALGIDFGTSNSAVAAVRPDGTARLLPLEGDATALPTAVFFNAEDKTVHFGREAMGLYLAGVDGRLMRSLKSLLGSSLMQEHTAIGWGEMRFTDIIARFLAELGERARRQLGALPARVTVGRPVHFVDDAPERDRQAQEALQQAALAAGFQEVGFEMEPIAAALDYERRMAAEAVVLIVDVGGGTSDFTVVRLGPDRIRRADRADDILATSGVHLGGTDFDRRLNLARVMPLLGFGHRGPQGREVPSRVFMDLATWHLINFLHAPRTLAQVRALRANYGDLRLYERLLAVLQRRLGHRIAGEVEQAKIDCSNTGGTALIDLAAVEPGLQAELTGGDMALQLQPLLGQVVDCAHECLRRAGVPGERLGAVYLTGGSSALKTFQNSLRQAFPGVPLVEGDLFGGVASGLAYASGRARSS